MTGEHITSFAREHKPYTLEFTINELPKILSNGSHSSWRAVAAIKRRFKNLTIEAVAGRVPKKPLERAKLTLIRHSSQEPDFDGLVISFKSALDALKTCGVILDDKSSVIGQPTYLWQKAKVRQGKITILIEEVTK